MNGNKYYGALHLRLSFKNGQSDITKVQRTGI
jgi:hypothetical protein